MAQTIPLNKTHLSKSQATVSQDDPYFLVKNNVTDCINRTKTLVQEYHQLPSSTPVPQLNQKLALLQSNLQSIQTDIEDIQESISIVEQHPNRFKLTKDDILKRKQFLDWCKSNLNEIQSIKTSAQAKFEKQQRDKLLKASPKQNALLTNSSIVSSSINTTTDPNLNPKTNAFLESHTGQQQMLIRQQDEQLESVLSTVTNMKEVALTMGKELDDQVGLLREMDENVDQTQNRLSSAMTRMKLILKKSNDTKSTCVIIALTVILIILLIFIII